VERRVAQLSSTLRPRSLANAGTTEADLAGRAGLRKASLFHHFASKEALYHAVFDRLIAKMSRLVIPAVQAEGSFVARLDRMYALHEPRLSAGVLVRAFSRA